MNLLLHLGFLFPICNHSLKMCQFESREKPLMGNIGMFNFIKKEGSKGWGAKLKMRQLLTMRLYGDREQCAFGDRSILKHTHL